MAGIKSSAKKRDSKAETKSQNLSSKQTEKKVKKLPELLPEDLSIDQLSQHFENNLELIKGKKVKYSISNFSMKSFARVNVNQADIKTETRFSKKFLVHPELCSLETMNYIGLNLSKKLQSTSDG